MSKILVIRGGAIGDFILTLPVLSALRQQFPSARVEVLGYPHIAQLAVAGGLADQARSIEARPLAGFFARGATLDGALQEYFASFPVIVSYLYDPDQIFQSNVLRSCKGQFIAGLHRPDKAKCQHATEVFLEPLQRLAIFEADPIPRLALAVECSDPHAKWIALHPGSGSEQKNWPLQHWITLAKAASEIPGVSLLLVGGEAEGDKLKVLAQHLDARRTETAFGLPLVELGRRLAGCSAFVGHDSGITHLAAAVGIPTMALWADTAENVWGPRGERVMILRDAGGLRNLSPERVVQALRTAV